MNSDKRGCDKMIIQTGMRTDIPAFYSKWFLKRISECMIHSMFDVMFNSVPENCFHRISRISVSVKI